MLNELKFKKSSSSSLDLATHVTGVAHGDMIPFFCPWNNFFIFLKNFTTYAALSAFVNMTS